MQERNKPLLDHIKKNNSALRSYSRQFPSTKIIFFSVKITKFENVHIYTMENILSHDFSFKIALLHKGRSK